MCNGLFFGRVNYTPKDPHTQSHILRFGSEIGDPPYAERGGGRRARVYNREDLFAWLRRDTGVAPLLAHRLFSRRVGAVCAKPGHPGGVHITIFGFFEPDHGIVLSTTFTPV